MIGSAVGGALGAPFKGLNPNDLELEPWPLEIIDGRHTDGVKTMMKIAESLIGRGGFNGGDIANRLLPNLSPSKKSNLKPVRASPRTIVDGASLKTANNRLLGGGDHSDKNVTAGMTTLGLFYYDDLETLRETCHNFGSIIRLHRMALEGAMAHAYAVALSVEETPWGGMDPTDLIEEVESLIEHPLYRDRLRAIRRFLNSPQDRGSIVKVLGNPSEALNSVPTALYCALSRIESFEAAVSYAVGLGGDTDTIASLTGAVSGVLHCLEDIPYRWRARLEDVDHISDLANKLLKAREINRGYGAST
ncbi:MAG: ADP-ribosylglycohydrolase family protein [Candidatus Bathyarchaeia archaeon]